MINVDSSSSVVSVAYDFIAPTRAHHLSRSHASKAAFTTELIRALMKSNHLVGDLPFPLLPGALPKRMSVLKFPTSHLVQCSKYPGVYLLHKKLFSSCPKYAQHSSPDLYLKGVKSSLIIYLNVHIFTAYGKVIV